MTPIYIGRKYYTDDFLRFYTRRAEGGAGLLIVPIPLDGCSAEVIRQDFIDQSTCLIEKCHSYNCKVIPQIFPGKGELVNDYSIEELESIPGYLSQLALHLKRIGFDGIEIHGAHHSLFMHLLSPLLNNRHDKYGGQIERTMELQLLTVKYLRKLVGDEYPLLYRFSATEYSDGGVNLSTIIQFAKQLESAGVDCIDVSAGGTGASPQYSDCPDHTHNEGCFSEFSNKIKQNVTIPVIVAGRIASRKTAEMIIREKKADCVGLGRVLIADPDWPNKIMTNNDEAIIHIDKWYNIYKNL